MCTGANTKSPIQRQEKRCLKAENKSGKNSETKNRSPGTSIDLSLLVCDSLHKAGKASHLLSESLSCSRVFFHFKGHYTIFP